MNTSRFRAVFVLLIVLWLAFGIVFLSSIFVAVIGTQFGAGFGVGFVLAGVTSLLFVWGLSVLARQPAGE